MSRTQIRMLNAWKPAAPPPPREPGVLTVADDGSGVLTTRSGLRTALEPIDFYKQVGRDDLAVALAERVRTRQSFIAGGAALVVIASALFFGNAIYQLSNCPGLGDEGCGPNSPEPSTANPGTVSALNIASALGTALGVGLLIAGVAQQPDEGGPGQRRALAADYNARTAKADPAGPDGGAISDEAGAPAGSLSADARAQLRTLRAIPIAADGARGMALAISF